MKKFIAFVVKKKWLVIFSFLTIGTIGYFAFPKIFPEPETFTYTTAVVEKGNLQKTISGTGQISATNQVDIKPKTAGDIIRVYAKTGQSVKKNQILIQLDSSDAYKTVRDAKANLQSAEISYQKLVQATDELTLLQAQNSLTSAEENKRSAEDNLQKTYDDIYNKITDAFLDLPGIVTGIENIIHNTDYESNQNNLAYYYDTARRADENKIFEIDSLKNKTETSFSTAETNYEIAFTNYEKCSINSDRQTLENLLNETYETIKNVSDSIKTLNNFLDFVENILETSSLNSNLPSELATHQNNLDQYTGLTSSHLSSLLSIKNSLASYKTQIISYERTINEKRTGLVDLQNGADLLDIETQKLTLEQKRNSLNDAYEKLADYSVRAPFAGIIASFSAELGDSASSGTAIGTIITQQKIATIALNEVDIAQIKVGQKTNLTFDAIENLNITGEVIEVDSIGTTSQGVVSYNVKISLDVDDERIKPGMSISAIITVSNKTDILQISSSAIKNGNGQSYVEIFDENKNIIHRTITVGDSNDTMTEITSGIEEGEEIILKKISNKTNSTTATGKTSTTNNQNPMGGMMRELR
ncbi:MAG: efflux RND transporter periplasmic adaptor subunit [Patescibacteria group bacterium]